MGEKEKQKKEVEKEEEEEVLGVVMEIAYKKKEGEKLKKAKEEMKE